MTIVRLSAAFGLFVAVAPCQVESSVTVQGVNGKTVSLSVADLSRFPQHKVDTTDHGTPVAFEGVLVSDVLAGIDAPQGEKLGGKALLLCLVVEAEDGYKAVFAFPELDPAFTDKKVYLVTKRDGKPLSEKEGPFRIVLPDETPGKVGSAR